MITITRNTNSGIRILPKQAEPKPECRQAESIPQIGASIQEAAKMLGISRPHFYPLIKEGKVRTVKIGKRVVVSIQSLRDFVDGTTEPGNLVENAAELQGRE